MRGGAANDIPNSRSTDCTSSAICAAMSSASAATMLLSTCRSATRASRANSIPPTAVMSRGAASPPGTADGAGLAVVTKPAAGAGSPPLAVADAAAAIATTAAAAIVIAVLTTSIRLQARGRHARRSARSAGIEPRAIAPDLDDTLTAMNAIETQRLTKDYGAGRGIFDLDLTVREGEILGFLGPNGAGKTTTIKLLMGTIRPTRGSAAIFGLDAQAQAVDVKRIVGYVPGELPQFGGWKGSEIVAWVAGLRGGLDGAEVTRVAERLDLDLGRRYREYSHGNKQKLALLLAFVHRPRLLILDEPTTGLDPLHQRVFYELLREARGPGATAFLSSHVMSEVEHVCDRVGIVREGRLVTAGAPRRPAPRPSPRLGSLFPCGA